MTKKHLTTLIPTPAERVRYYVNDAVGLAAARGKRLQVPTLDHVTGEDFARNALTARCGEVMLVSLGLLEGLRNDAELWTSWTPRGGLPGGDLMHTWFMQGEPLVDILRTLPSHLRSRHFLYTWGDNMLVRRLPGLVSKARPVEDTHTVLFNLNPERHWGGLGRTAAADVPYASKRDSACWRGVPSGLEPAGVRQGRFVAHGPRFELVRRWHRHRGTLDVGWSYLVHDPHPFWVPGVSRIMSDSLLGNASIKGKMSLEEMLQHKLLISVEGFDVASDLKWKLFSNSVVLMPPPTRVSWLMEDRLVPLLHYIPLHANLSDLGERVEWALAHPARCEAIARAATQWIEQFLIPAPSVNSTGGTRSSGGGASSVTGDAGGGATSADPFLDRYAYAALSDTEQRVRRAVLGTVLETVQPVDNSPDGSGTHVDIPAAGASTAHGEPPARRGTWSCRRQRVFPAAQTLCVPQRLRCTIEGNRTSCRCRPVRNVATPEDCQLLCDRVPRDACTALHHNKYNDCWLLQPAHPEQQMRSEPESFDHGTISCMRHASTTVREGPPGRAVKDAVVQSQHRVRRAHPKMRRRRHREGRGGR